MCDSQLNTREALNTRIKKPLPTVVIPGEGRPLNTCQVYRHSDCLKGPDITKTDTETHSKSVATLIQQPSETDVLHPSAYHELHNSRRDFSNSLRELNYSPYGVLNGTSQVCPLFSHDIASPANDQSTISNETHTLDHISADLIALSDRPVVINVGINFPTVDIVAVKKQQTVFASNWPMPTEQAETLKVLICQISLAQEELSAVA